MLIISEKLYNNNKPTEMGCFYLENMKKNDVMYYILLSLYIIFNIVFGYLFINNIINECYVNEIIMLIILC
ncbi:hypothetical protein MYSEV_249 [Mythimna separata entomopoxvirus 'L']|uniref:Uncharacterized protein n=1 Tax=Mythimna separata entomopoxvirus 'L' TaxID=1293572 RepID=A0A916KQE6_9POXV|nr:hypothetical protein MYSEV_249 [Mythimna separata entomopoxvirus 'L']CCU56447.1 hypothetical protein MYSEV_249 [Mythimna separata entomopoxvirus 'L']